MATLYAAEGGSLAGSLYTLDSTTGAATLVGSMGSYAITGMAFRPSDGVLFGSTANGSPTNPKWLVTIDPTTGAVTPVGAFGVTGFNTMADIAFAADDTLYGIASSQHRLYTINTSTGAATQVSTQTPGGFGNAFDFLGDDQTIVLFADGSDGDLRWVTRSDGSFIVKGTCDDSDLVNNGVSIAAASFGPDQLLYALANDFSSDVYLTTVGWDTGVFTNIGDTTRPTLDALAWDTWDRPSPPTDPAANNGGDNFVDRVTLSGDSGGLFFDNTGYTVEDDEPNETEIFQNVANIFNTMWWEWTPTLSGWYRWWTEQPAFAHPGTELTDTILTVYTGTTLLDLVFVEGNDDILPVTPNYIYTGHPYLTATDERSELMFFASAGTTYYVRVASSADDTFDVPEGFSLLKWEPVTDPFASNDDFANAIVISGASGTSAADARFASSEAGEPLEDQVDGDGHRAMGGTVTFWWKWTAPETRPYLFQTKYPWSYLDSGLAATCADASEFFDDDVSLAGVKGNSFFWPTLRVDAEAGTEYLLRIETDRFNAQLVAEALTWVEYHPVNDDFAAGTSSLFVTAGTFITNNIWATKQVGEPDHGGDPTATTSIWYTYTESLNSPGAVTINASPWVESGQPLNDIIIDVYTGSSVGSLTLIASGHNTVTFQPVYNTTYHISFTGAGGAEGYFFIGPITQYVAPSTFTIDPADDGTVSNPSQYSNQTALFSNDNGLGQTISTLTAYGVQTYLFTPATTGVYMWDIENTDLSGAPTSPVTAAFIGAFVNNVQARASSVKGTGSRGLILVSMKAGRQYQIKVGTVYGISGTNPDQGYRPVWVIHWHRFTTGLIGTDSGGSFAGIGSNTIDMFPVETAPYGCSVRFKLTMTAGPPTASTVLAQFGTDLGNYFAALTIDQNGFLINGAYVEFGLPDVGDSIYIELYCENTYYLDPPTKDKDNTHGIASGVLGVTFNGLPMSVGTFFAVFTDGDRMRYFRYGMISGSAGIGVEISDITYSDDKSKIPLSSQDPNTRDVYYLYGWEAKTRGVGADRTHLPGGYTDALEFGGTTTMEPFMSTVALTDRDGWGLRVGPWSGLGIGRTAYSNLQISEAQFYGGSLPPKPWGSSPVGHNFTYSFYFRPQIYPDVSTEIVSIVPRDLFPSLLNHNFLISINASGVISARMGSINAPVENLYPVGTAPLNEWTHVEVLVDQTFFGLVTMKVSVNGTVHTLEEAYNIFPYGFYPGSIRVGANTAPFTFSNPIQFDMVFDDVAAYAPHLFPIRGYHIKARTPAGIHSQENKAEPFWTEDVNNQYDLAPYLGWDWNVGDDGGWTSYPTHTLPVIAPVIIGVDNLGFEGPTGDEPDPYPHDGTWGLKGALVQESHAADGLFEASYRSSAGLANMPFGRENYSMAPSSGLGWDSIPYRWEWMVRADDPSPWRLWFSIFTINGVMRTDVFAGTDWTVFGQEVGLNFVFGQPEYPIFGQEWEDGVLRTIEWKTPRLYKIYVASRQRRASWVSPNGGASYSLVDDLTDVSFIGTWPPPAPREDGNILAIYRPGRGWGQGGNHVTIDLDDTDTTDVYAVRQYAWAKGNWPDIDDLQAPGNKRNPNLGLGVLRQRFVTGGVGEQLRVRNVGYSPNPSEEVNYNPVTTGLVSTIIPRPGGGKWSAAAYNDLTLKFWQKGYVQAAWDGSNNWGDAVEAPAVIEAMFFEVMEWAQEGEVGIVSFSHVRTAPKRSGLQIR